MRSSEFIAAVKYIDSWQSNGIESPKNLDKPQIVAPRQGDFHEVVELIDYGKNLGDFEYIRKAATKARDLVNQARFVESVLLLRGFIRFQSRWTSVSISNVDPAYPNYCHAFNLLQTKAKTYQKNNFKFYDLEFSALLRECHQNLEKLELQGPELAKIVENNKKNDSIAREANKWAEEAIKWAKRALWATMVIAVVTLLFPASQAQNWVMGQIFGKKDVATQDSKKPVEARR